MENCKEGTLKTFTSYADSQDYYNKLQRERVIFTSKHSGAKMMFATYIIQLNTALLAPLKWA